MGCSSWWRPALLAAAKLGLVGAVHEDEAAREAYWGQVRGSAVQFNTVQSNTAGPDTAGGPLPGGDGAGGPQGHLHGGEGAQ